MASGLTVSLEGSVPGTHGLVGGSGTSDQQPSYQGQGQSETERGGGGEKVCVRREVSESLPSPSPEGQSTENVWCRGQGRALEEIRSCTLHMPRARTTKPL